MTEIARVIAEVATIVIVAAVEYQLGRRDGLDAGYEKAKRESTRRTRTAPRCETARDHEWKLLEINTQEVKPWKRL